ncbi:dihydrodipicolinate synthase family protein, partial [Gracilibacillus dipsosauri]|uniref:dihydrodipicolinate synthase family protein n=1 Tax=Gracilibacillus dipsosauri TaxID=178340 RepID=UPI002409967D
MQEMIRLFEAGKHKEAAKLHRQLVPIMNGLFMTPSPTAVKEALKMKGLDVGNTRLPLVPLTEEEKTQLKGLIQHYL